MSLEDELKDALAGNNNTTSSDDDGGGGGGGGGSTADPFFSDRTKAQKYSLLQSVYTSLWGEPATEEYLKAAVNQGFNRWEFEERERNKPAFRKTETYRDDASNLADLLHSLGVV